MKSLLVVLALILGMPSTFAYYDAPTSDIVVSRVFQGNSGLIQSEICNEGDASTGNARLMLTVSVSGKKKATTTLSPFELDSGECETYDVATLSRLSIREAGSYRVALTARLSGGYGESTNTNNSKSELVSIGTTSSYSSSTVKSLFGDNYVQSYYQNSNIPNYQNIYTTPVTLQTVNPVIVSPHYITYPNVGTPDFTAQNIRFQSYGTINGSTYSDAIIVDVCNIGEVYRSTAVLAVAVSLNGVTALAKTPDYYSDWQKNECRSVAVNTSQFPNIYYGSSASTVFVRVDAQNAVQERNESNNETQSNISLTRWNTPSSSVGVGADLQASAIRASNQYVEVQICNTGYNLPHTEVRLELKNESTGQSQIKSMYQAFSQGTCTWVSFEGLQSFQYNQFNFRATVDPNNSIAESNESNNSTTATIATYRGNITSSNNSPVYYVSQPSIDLEIVGIQSLSNNSGLAEITLCNRGAFASNSFSVPIQASLGSSETLTNSYSVSLVSGNCSQVVIRIPTRNSSYYSPTSLKITIDPNATISDSNRSNNTYQTIIQ